MLILSRRAKDKVSFPQVGVTVHFIRVQSGQVKIGVDAPRNITIVRDEVSDGDAIAEMVRRRIACLPRETRHGIRNELQEIMIGLHLYRELIDAGLKQEAEDTFQSLHGALKRLDANEALQRPDAVQQDNRTSSPIVIIETVANERRMLADTLKMNGYSIVEFSSFADALGYLEGCDPPRAILTDLKTVDGGDGKELQLFRGSERFNDVPVFAISETSPEEHGIEMGTGGIDIWMPKPLSIEALMTSLGQVIGGPNSDDVTSTGSSSAGVPAENDRFETGYALR